MPQAQRMVETNPGPVPFDAQALAACLQACFACEQVCSACADACLGEQDVAMLRRCIRLNLDCADICAATGRILSRQTAFDPQLAQTMLQACAAACKLCGDECQQHAQHGMAHGQTCMEACRRCEQACQTLLQALAAQFRVSMCGNRWRNRMGRRWGAAVHVPLSTARPRLTSAATRCRTPASTRYRLR